MLPLMQIAIYVGVVILGFKAVEIFQLAFLSESPNRKKGLILGVTMIAIAFVVGSVAVVTTEFVTHLIADDWFYYPRIRSN